jgi:hypothetical protein
MMIGLWLQLMCCTLAHFIGLCFTGDLPACSDEGDPVEMTSDLPLYDREACFHVVTPQLS